MFSTSSTSINAIINGMHNLIRGGVDSVTIDTANININDDDNDPIDPEQVVNTLNAVINDYTPAEEDTNNNNVVANNNDVSL